LNLTVENDGVLTMKVICPFVIIVDGSE